MNKSVRLPRIIDSKRWLAPGSAYARRPIVHDAAYQVPRLHASGVDPALYGHLCEPGLFGLDCFDSMTKAGLDINGYVFLSQTYRQITPIALGEEIMICGYVRDLVPVRLGLMVHEIYRLEDSEGRVRLETELTGLLADPPDVDPGIRASAPSLPKRREHARDTWIKLKEKRLTPDDVRTFSQDVGNEIHFDVDFAHRHGFRAPIAQGVMSAVWLISSLPESERKSRFHVNVRYLRPVFWDDEATLWVRRNADGAIEMAETRNAEGKVTADLAVLSLTGNHGRAEG